MARTRNDHSFVSRGGGHKRATEWIASADVSDKTTLAAATAVLDQSFTQAQFSIFGPGTIVRTRGTIWTSSDQIAASEEPFGAIGMMVVREQARAAGIASIPTPITEEFDDGFFVHGYWGGMAQQVTAASTRLWYRYDFDSKAQRKVSPDDAVVVTMENASAADGVLYLMKFRMLFKRA